MLQRRLDLAIKTSDFYKWKIDPVLPWVRIKLASFFYFCHLVISSSETYNTCQLFFPKWFPCKLLKKSSSWEDACVINMTALLKFLSIMKQSTHLNSGFFSHPVCWGRMTDLTWWYDVPLAAQGSGSWPVSILYQWVKVVKAASSDPMAAREPVLNPFARPEAAASRLCSWTGFCIACMLFWIKASARMN